MDHRRRCRHPRSRARRALGSGRRGRRGTPRSRAGPGARPGGAASRAGRPSGVGADLTGQRRQRAGVPRGRLPAGRHGGVTRQPRRRTARHALTTGPIAFAALAALVWGAGDFCGGKGTQRAPAFAVTVVSQLLSTPLLVLGVLLLPGTPSAADLGWSAAAGVAGLFGIVLLYKALSTGAMSVVAPVTAVTGAAVPIVVGLFLEQTPGWLALGGAGSAVGAIA